MGTNYYTKRIPTEKEYEEMKLLLMKREFLKLQELIHKSTVSYHIGKCSAGWAFGFQAKDPNSSNEFYDQVPWDDNLESIKSYLQQDNIKIVDEYDEEYTFDQFWDSIKDIIYISDEHVGDKLYCQKHPEEKNYSNNYEYEKDNIRWIKTWFC